MPDFLPGFLDLVVVTVAAPIITWVLKRIAPDALSGMGVNINSTASLALYAAAWWLGGAERAELGGYVVAWMGSALAGANFVAAKRKAWPGHKGREREWDV